LKRNLEKKGGKEAMLEQVNRGSPSIASIEKGEFIMIHFFDIKANYMPKLRQK